MPYSHLPEEEQARQRRIDYNATFGSEHGHRVLQDLITDVCHLYQTSIGKDIHEMAIREGERNVGLQIMEQLNHELRSRIL
jgi:hypothetical protein